jgi:hypothetical protein
MIHKPPELPGQLAITPETHQVVVPYVLDHLSDETLKTRAPTWPRSRGGGTPAWIC